ncbi:MAG: hypothetical protein GTO22_07230 [Gemmatimonadales bacterium]|nr:hypothetical protein [Gemmatimonadales bacterium]
MIQPHVTVLFPVPERVGLEHLVTHIQQVLSTWEPFEIRLGGLEKSPDHWLLLTLREGNDTVKELYRSLYTGILAEFRRDDIEFVPHVGLGLFLKRGATYDSWNPQESDLDEDEFEGALREAETWPDAPSSVVDTLHMVGIPDDVMQWLSGQRPRFPRSARLDGVRRFRLCVETTRGNSRKQQ